MTYLKQDFDLGYFVFGLVIDSNKCFNLNYISSRCWWVLKIFFYLSLISLGWILIQVFLIFNFWSWLWVVQNVLTGKKIICRLGFVSALSSNLQSLCAQSCHKFDPDSLIRNFVNRFYNLICIHTRFSALSFNWPTLFMDLCY